VRFPRLRGRNRGTTLTSFTPPLTADPPFGCPPDRALTTAEGRALLAKPKKRNKYGVAPVKERTLDGIIFDSKREAARYAELKLLEKGGFIRQLELQPAFEFELNGKVIFKYIADFRYFEGKTRVVEDVKGVQTPLFRLKRKLIESQFNIKIVLVA
jgi:hypothetical protein